MKLVFWLFVLADTAALLLLFVLGLAAATSSRTSGWVVAGYMLVLPGLLLGASVLLFLRSTSPLGRGVALLMAAAPILVIVAMRGIASMQLRLNSDAEGNLTFFRAGPMRDMAMAISRNDPAAVTSLASGVNLNGRGLRGMTLLMYAFSELRESPSHAGVVRALIQAGADPNLGTDELPLDVAIQESSKTGPELVTMLLDKGANPNAKDHFGTPVWFTAIGITVPIGVLEAVLAHGADLKARDPQGGNAVLYAANSSNWKAVLFLLERGADWKDIRTVNGLTFKDKVESDRRVYGAKDGLEEVMEFLEKH